MSERAIVAYTEKVAEEIAAEYANAPLEELHVWVRLAHQREAMVTEMYDLSQFDARFEAAPAGDAAAVIRSAVGSIWAHEEAHTHFLASVRGFSEALPGLAEVQGRMEGKITRSAVSDRGGLARFLIAIGASLKRVPDFAADLRRMNLRDLVQFYGELETTARMGYLRILELGRRTNASAERSDFGFTFQFDVARILSEERFHEDAFRAMSRWISPDGERFASTPAIECAKELHDLCERNLSLGAVQGLVDPALVISKGDPISDLKGRLVWASDGGLGKLFEDYGLSVPSIDRLPDAVRSI